MSSDCDSKFLLLEAKDITKQYAQASMPMQIFFDSLLRRPVKTSLGRTVLDKLSIEIHSGETVGIIGRNGAGKSTLLGILGNVIEPTSGEVRRYGRIATLLGLTAGFNPNFTGRENAYLFCSIQGIDKKGAQSRLSSIIEFADLGEYFDQPLRTYSSGMQSRLAFSCAVHVDADLIIIDETLAVGDASFKMKCYDRIRAMRDAGQTFLLVTHNQNLLASFCTRAIVIEDGKKLHDGSVFEAVEVYKSLRSERVSPKKSGKKKQTSTTPQILRDFSLSYDEATNRYLFEAKFKVQQTVECIAFNFGIRNSSGISVCAIDGSEVGPILRNVVEGQEYMLTFSFGNHLLGGKYFISYIANQVLGDACVPLEMAQNFYSFDVANISGLTGIVNLDMGLTSTKV